MTILTHYLEEIPYTCDDLLQLATCSLRHKQAVTNLVNFYKYVTTELWTQDAIANLKAEHPELNVRKATDKAQLAQYMAEIELEYCESAHVLKLDGFNSEIKQLKAELEITQQALLTAKTESTKQIKAATQTAKLITVALIEPGLPLNGRQETPAFKVFNSPTTKDQLVSNYKLLRKQLHPDTCTDLLTSDFINDRFNFINALFKQLLNNWDDKYNPTLELKAGTLEKAMAVKLPFEPSHFDKYF